MNETSGMITSPIMDYLRELQYQFARMTDGTVADYIPELAKADSEWFGICLATTEGHVYEVGDSRQEFTIQSISKPFVYGLALEDNGRADMLGKIGVEPTGDAFNSISLDPATGRPANPMINAGAIAAAGQIMGHDDLKRINRILEMLSCYAGRALGVDETVYLSESETGHRNRAIGYMLRNFNILEEDPTPTLELYFKQCSISVCCRDLAVMGATLANAGINPVTGERAIRGEYVENVLGVMGSCGMYDYAGEWIYKVGMPAKSGVAGGILAVLPGRLGIGVFSPRLDARGNSVRGIEVCNRISMDFNLHMFNVVQPGKSVIRRSYDGTRKPSKHLRGTADRARLQQQAQRIRVYEIQGDLNFTTVEVIVSEIVSRVAETDFFIVDFKRVLTLDQSSCRMFYQLLLKLERAGKQLLFANCDSFSNLGGYIRRKLGDADSELWRSFEDDYALEYCEDVILNGENEKYEKDEKDDEAPIASFADFELFAGLGPDAIEVIANRLTRQAYTRGELIMAQGEPASKLFLLASGKVSIKLELPDGKTKRLATLSPGLVFGEMAWVERSQRSAAVIADRDSLCYQLEMDDFDALASEHGEIRARMQENLLRIFSRNLRKANDEIGVLS
jgi:glutaminase